MDLQTGQPDAQYRDLLDDVAVQPVFVMGDHRTGTTLLYKLLGATGWFNTVSIYHVVDRHRLIHNRVHHLDDSRMQELAALFEQKGLNDRVFDGVKTGPDMPEEYGFVLNSKSFRAWLRPDNVELMHEFCKKVQLTSVRDRPLLLKNPWDFFLNFMYVKQAFPAAKYVFIHRNPISTINSQLRATRSIFNSRNEYIALVSDVYRQLFSHPVKLRATRLLFSSHFDLGLRLVSRHVARGVDYYLKHVAALPPEDYVCVRYEDLCAAPEQTMLTILDALGLQAGAEVDYRALIRPRAGALLPEVSRSKVAIFESMKPFFEYGGYSVVDA